MEQKFQEACDRAKKFIKRPPDNELLELYSYYKQAVVGDVNIPKPNDPKGKAKWEAWNSRKGILQPLAKEKYVQIVHNLAPKYEK
ncbi:acyl-CoA-binding protein homolog isoform X2 [Onthophagus taurus]|uniref:acyl-CoA-binding protein homolog isoform X2 n=1 Tax=Onthophagus taurus TaxID=166361 RepID=UPI000C20F24F|nr:acyl-CoA-binding protein homolog [Onthophagus taurus]